MTAIKILTINQEKNHKNCLIHALNDCGYPCHEAENGREGLHYLKEKECDLALVDMHMDDMNSFEFIKKAKSLSAHLAVIIVAERGSVENAVEAMNLGAYHYLTKPVNVKEILVPLIVKLKENNLIKNNSPKIKENQLPQEIIAESVTMQKIITKVSLIAKSNAHVFITGESGTGKEVIAQAIHNLSPRNRHPFIRVNCAAIPETLIESEFFGHEKGAFTGANIQRPGRFERAHQGTLLLDEVTETPLSLQAKLLRAVQEQEFERLGGTKLIHVNVRIISTSNQDVKSALEKKLLRTDLFYRLNVVPIHLPPLRERQDDILALADYFVKKLCVENEQEQKCLTQKAKAKLLNYDWPGNIRELANTIERAIVMTSEGEITDQHLWLDHTPNPIEQKITLAGIEKQHIIETLHAHGNDRCQVAKILGITPRRLDSKINSYQIDL